MEKTYVRVAKVSEVPEGRSKRVSANGEEIALWRVNGKFYAIHNVCSHQHFSVLHQGILAGIAVTCPMHGWTYSLETGRAEVGNGSVRTFEVRIVGNDVLIEEPEQSW